MSLPTSTSTSGSSPIAMTDSPPPLFHRSSNDRLSLPFGTRLTVAVLLSSGIGSFLGLSHGSQATALRFRAENSHRLPRSQKGWYLYHRSKNYAVILGGAREARRMGVKVGFWTGMFFVLEDVVDAGRKARAEDWGAREPGKDALSTVCGALTTAGAFSLWHRLPLTTTATMARMGLVVGLAYGAAQDAISVWQGRRIGYVDWARRITGFGAHDEGRSSA